MIVFFFVDCKAVELISNGFVVHKSDWPMKIGSTVLYGCNEGYILLGSVSRSCTVESKTLIWFPGAPFCVKQGILYGIKFF